MELNEIVYSRRSVRKYKANMSIDEATINEIISFAQEAPSWKNSQVGRYHVVLSDEAKNKMKMCLPEFNVNNTINACAYIVCTYKMNRSGYNKDGTPTNELGNKWGTYDLGLQNELLLLKAKELGIDSLIMGIRDANLIKEQFNIPEDEEIVSVISLGYGDIDPVKPQRKETKEILSIY